MSCHPSTSSPHFSTLFFPSSAHITHLSLLFLPLPYGDPRDYTDPTCNCRKSSPLEGAKLSYIFRMILPKHLVFFPVGQHGHWPQRSRCSFPLTVVPSAIQGGLQSWMSTAMPGTPKFSGEAFPVPLKYAHLTAFLPPCQGQRACAEITVHGHHRP